MTMFKNFALWNKFFLILILWTISVQSAKTLFSRPGSNIKPNDATTTLKPPTTTTANATGATSVSDISIGPCTWVIDRKCPDPDVKFYLYTRQNLMDRQLVHIDDTLDKSNLTESYFNPKLPTKIIVHGYNSNMFLKGLLDLHNEYLSKAEYNIFYVDWSILAPGPCYISAVHNTRHAGACVAQLVQRIRDSGTDDMHVIGFSLGAQLTNYIAQNLGSFLLPRITGLDPAMPLFITASAKDKLDESDAAYVDVIHTNALVQGKIERCGHADFYMNGGIVQAGCTSEGFSVFACSHQRAPAYFLESIHSHKGFWGWPCSSYLAYALGMCPPTNYLVEVGENIRHSTKGIFFVETNDTAPYALGKWTDLPTLGAKKRPTLILTPPKRHGDPLLMHIDQWGKLDSNFNNIEESSSLYEPNKLSNSVWHNYFSVSSASTTHTPSYDDSIEEQVVVVRNADASLNDATDLSTEEHAKNWEEYRRNLTAGFIENSIFQMPQIKGIIRNRKRG